MGKKVKVVFDTNVWISIFLKKAIGKEFTEIFEKVEVYVTRGLLEEISRVLVYPKIEELLELSGVSKSGILQRIVENSALVNPRFKFRVIEEDPEDDKVLDCALQAHAEFIVSGDRHLLKLRKFRDVRILSPRGFLDALG
jgi:hypothetical protein